MLRHFHHRIDNSRHVWFYASNKATAQRNSLGDQLSSNCGENAEPEAETVSVFQDHQSRMVPAGTSNQSGVGESGSGRCGNNVSGEGGDGVVFGGEKSEVELESARNPSQEAAELTAHGDETDSTCLSSQHTHRHIPFQTHSKRKRDREQGQGSKWLSSTSEVHQFSESPLTQIERNHKLSQGLVSFQEDGPLTDKLMMSQRADQRTSSHQGGHLKLSGNGTLSLSFGSESAYKKPKTNPEGS